MRNITVDLYQDFYCIADACPNTCCKGWHIDIDNDTYKKMLDNEDKLGIAVTDWIEKTDKGYAVKLQSNTLCPLLNEKKLCKVVLTLGPSYLGHTCTEYPRFHRTFGNVMEYYLAPSCADVIDKLMSKEKICFYTSEDNSPALPYLHTELYQYESLVRTGIMDLLYDFRDIPLSTRLFASFSIINKAVSCCQNNTSDFNIIKQSFDSYYSNGTMSALNSQLQKAVSENSRFQFLQRLVSILPVNISSITPPDYVRLIQQAVDYFNQTGFEEYLKDITSFKEAIRSYNNFYTNYWVYRFFTELISIPDYSQIKDNFIFICIEFCLMQILALASYSKKNVLDRKEYIYIISSVGRKEHASRKGLMSQLRDNNLISNAGLLLMII